MGADCTGHGVTGAMVSLVGMNSLDKVVREESHETSYAMVDSLNTHMKQSLQRGGESVSAAEQKEPIGVIQQKANSEEQGLAQEPGETQTNA